MAEASFTMTLIGSGYATKIDDVEKQHSDRPDKRIVTRVTGPGWLTLMRYLGHDGTPVHAINVDLPTKRLTNILLQSSDYRMDDNKRLDGNFIGVAIFRLTALQCGLCISRCNCFVEIAPTALYRSASWPFCYV